MPFHSCPDGSFAERFRPPIEAVRSMRPRPDAGRAPLPIVRIPLHHPLRTKAEACIRAVYASAFDAYDVALAPLLVAYVGDGGQIHCAAGIRTAADGFFSENYLDAPIERILERSSWKSVDRRSIVEVSTLASTSARLSPPFVQQIARFGRAAGFEWSIFTATARLRRLLSGLGIPVVTLAVAERSRVAEPERWGDYYMHAPHVCAVARQWLERSAATDRSALPRG
ncbi:MAG: thermostable hemolysin [Rhodospirillales bacterium]